MLTNTDVNKIRTALRDEIGLQLEEKLGLEPGQTLDDKLFHLPSKEEFFTENDKLMTELKAIREEQTVISHHHQNFSGRLEKIEKIYQVI